MVKRCKVVVHGCTLCIYQAQARLGVNVTYAGDRCGAGLGCSQHGGALCGWRAEHQLVVISTAQYTLQACYARCILVKLATSPR